MDNMDHLITKAIRSYFKNRLYAPIIYLVFLLALYILLPISQMMFPRTYDTENLSVQELYVDKEYYALFQFHDLHFTGYTSVWITGTRGYYYYTMVGEDCVVVLLDPVTCEQGNSSIADLTVEGRIIHDSPSQRSLLKNLAADFGWPEDGVRSIISDYTISEPDATNFASRFLVALFYVTGIFDLLCIIFYGLFIIFPKLSPQVLRLNAYGHAWDMFEHAEEELATLPQLATEDMFITEHYFIETSNYGVAIVPIDSIVWIYKYSTLHKLLWHHFAISYTLHITTERRHYIKCPKNIKSDIDGIMDYLAEANHNILVGFSEENRVLVEEMQDEYALVRRIRGRLARRVSS